jgi:hypothetical protein
LRAGSVERIWQGDRSCVREEKKRKGLAIVFLLLGFCRLPAPRLLRIGFGFTLALSAAVVLVLAGCSHSSSATFASGGLGLSRREWERRNGRASAQDSAEVLYIERRCGCPSLKGFSNASNFVLIRELPVRQELK